MKTKNRRALRLRFDRTLSHDPLRQMLILVGVLAFAFIISYIFLLHECLSYIINISI